MELRRLDGYGIGFMILLCSLATGITEGKRRAAETVFENVAAETNEKMAEHAWIHGNNELIDQKYSFGEFDYHMPKEAPKDIGRILTRRDRHKAISALPPQMKEKLFDCLRKKGLVIGGPAQGASSRHWVVKCIEFLSECPTSPRRNLESKPLRHVKPTSTPSPVHNPAPTTTSASPVHSPAPATAPESSFHTSASESPVYTPKLLNQAAASSLSPNSLALLFFSKKIDDQQDRNGLPPPSPSTKTSKHSPLTSHYFTHYSPEPRNDNIEQETLVAVAVTAAVTFCIAAMLFCCWLCCKGSNHRNGFRDGFRDERPLLHLSDFSASSSQHSHNLENPSTKEHSLNGGTNAAYKSNLSMKYGNHVSSQVEAPSSEANTEEALHQLKPPPVKAPPTPPGPPPSPLPSVPRPPPPPKASRAPPPPPLKGKLKPSPLGPHRRVHGAANEGDNLDSESGAPKAKLKPFFWDKVMANPDTSMVWHEIKAGSFQFNEEMIESLFGYNAANTNKNDQKKDLSELSTQYIQIIDHRKAQNLSILLRALNVTTEEVLDALREGNELPMELLQTLLKMAPTQEEELKLRLFTGNLSQLGPAERFLKILVDIPFAFKRVESLIFMSSLQEEVTTLKESFATLEVACKNLKNSRLFLKLLEAVLKTGNRMNDGTYRGGAQAFKLDTLLKLSDVKGTDGKTTLLHFVVQEIIRSEGIRAVRAERATQSVSSVKSNDFVEDSNQASEEHYCNVGLRVVSDLSGELKDVKQAAVIDADALSSTVSKLGQSLIKTKAFLDTDMKGLEEDIDFYHALANFADRADSDIAWLSKEEKRIMALVKSTADYFHGNAGRDEGLRLFTIVRDFLIMVDKACKDVKEYRASKPKRTSRQEALATSASLESRQDSDNSPHRLFPAIAGRRINYSSSDDESPSP